MRARATAGAWRSSLAGRPAFYLTSTPRRSAPGFILSDNLGVVDIDVACPCGRRSDVLADRAPAQHHGVARLRAQDGRNARRMTDHASMTIPHTEVAQPRAQATRAALAIAPGVLLAGVAGGMAFPIVPIVALDAHMALPWIGVILAANRVTRIAASPAIGALIDRIGTRRVFIGGLVLQVAVMALYAQGTASGRPGVFFLVARLVHGPSSACIGIAGQALALRSGGGGHGGRVGGMVRRDDARRAARPRRRRCLGRDGRSHAHLRWSDRRARRRGGARDRVAAWRRRGNRAPARRRPSAVVAATRARVRSARSRPRPTSQRTAW